LILFNAAFIDFSDEGLFLCPDIERAGIRPGRVERTESFGASPQPPTATVREAAPSPSCNAD
jgi:hypothetical protein